jgi:hypothetical protein
MPLIPQNVLRRQSSHVEKTLHPPRVCRPGFRTSSTAIPRSSKARFDDVLRKHVFLLENLYDRTRKANIDTDMAIVLPWVGLT